MLTCLANGADIAQVSVVNTMGIPDPAIESYLISHAQTRAAELIASLVSDQPVAGPATLTRVDALFDAFCGELLENLRRAVGSIDAPEAAWLRQHYLRLIVDFATALRDSIADATSRHAAAQVIQCKVLEHERHLRIALDSHGGLVPPTPPPTASPDADSSAVVKVSAKN